MSNAKAIPSAGPDFAHLLAQDVVIEGAPGAAPTGAQAIDADHSPVAPLSRAAVSARTLPKPGLMVDPVLQRDVLDQVDRPRLVACDTMNFWISGQPAELRKTLARVDVLLINDAEARQLSGEWNMVKAARAIRAMGPRVLVVKKGEHGVLMSTEDASFAAPAYPLEEVFDPTGAGDAFAGGFLGYLSGAAALDREELRRAVIYGSATGSYAVEQFSVERFRNLSALEVARRVEEFREMTFFEHELERVQGV